MKNKFIALALVTLSIATTTVSCTKNEDDLKPKAENVETTKVAFSVNAESNVSPTGRMVDRTAAPLYVDNLTITATCNGYGTPTVATELFTFGTNTPGASPLATGFGLNNVALGLNTFTASSGASIENKHLSLGSVILPSSGADVLDVMKAHTPYITTTATPVQKTITKTGNDVVSLTMNTNNGRILAKFVQESLADNYYTTVSAVVGGVNLGESIISPAPQGISPTAVGFEWSNENAIEGALVTFEIKIYEKGQGTLKGALLNTITKTVNVASAKTKLCTYTIHDTDVKTDITVGGISLIFPTITEVTVTE